MSSHDWYSVLALFESVVSDHDENLFEIRIVVVEAESEDMALEKVREQARNAFESYENVDGQRVDVLFRDVLAVKELYLESIRDGDEVFSEFLRKDEVKDLRRILNSPI